MELMPKAMSVAQDEEQVLLAKNSNNGTTGAWRVTARALVAILFALLVFILCLYSAIVGNLQRRYSGDRHDSDAIQGLRIPPDWSQESHLESSKVDALLDKLRDAIRLASDGADYSLTAEQRDAWNAQNPCQSRSELEQMYVSRSRQISSNPLWEKVLDEYSNLHRTCMKRVGNLTEYFLQKSTVNIPGCKFLIGQGDNGLGNKLLVTVSTVLYAIVSHRVLLVPNKFHLDSLLCEPFIGSSWILNTDKFPLPESGAGSNSWQGENVFMENMSTRLQSLKEEESGGTSSQTRSGTLPPLVDAIVVSAEWAGWQPHDWFYCNTEQQFLSEVPWVFSAGCIYSMPKLVASPPFRSTLKALFPDNMVLTRLLRSTILPSDTVWDRFKRLNHAYFHQADHRVAIQLRFFGTHSTMSDLMNDRVLDCVLTNSILPDVLNQSSKAANGIMRTVDIANKSHTVTAVYIASLYLDLHERLNEFYLGSPTATGEDVSVIQITNRQSQSTGPEEDAEAMVEVLLLSVADALLVTPGSTFGGLAQGYGALTPWFIRSTSESDTDLKSCERGQTVDFCQPGVSLGYNCPNDPREWNDPQVVPEQKLSSVGECLSIDNLGIQVLSRTS